MIHHYVDEEVATQVAQVMGDCIINILQTTMIGTRL